MDNAKHEKKNPNLVQLAKINALQWPQQLKMALSCVIHHRAMVKVVFGCVTKTMNWSVPIVPSVSVHQARVETFNDNFKIIENSNGRYRAEK